MRRSIDWEEARARLRAGESALEAALAESPARIEEAYRRRAAQLSAAQGAPRAVSVSLPALVFGLGRERYAVELKDLAEALPFTGCVRPPGAPRHFLGVISVRGELRPVLDLGRMLTGAEPEGAEAGVVLMLRRQVGLRVDQVEALRAIRREELTPAAQGNYVKALAPGRVMLLDVEKILAEVTA